MRFALTALRYCRRISWLASLRMIGLMGEPMRRAIRRTRSRTVTCVRSLEKLRRLRRQSPVL